MDRFNRPDGVLFHVAAVDYETGVIVRAAEQGAPGTQEREIERHRDVPGPANLQGMQKRREPKTVSVDLPARIEPSVESRRRLLHAQDTDFRGEIRIDGEEPGAWRKFSCRHIGVSDLAEGVDASIRSASAMDHHPTTNQLLQRLLQMILHRIIGGLALPPSKPPSIVGNRKLEPFVSSFHAQLLKHRLGIEPALENELRRRLVDDFAALLGIPAGLVQRSLRSNRREPLVP